MKKPIVYFGLGALVILLFLSFYFFFFRVPTDFPVGSIYSVKEGAGLSALAKNLSSQKIIRSPFLFKTLSVIFGGLKGIKTGDYALSEKQNLISLAWRFSSADYGLALVRITIPEGLNVKEMAILFSKKFSKITAESFSKVARDKEGYLFPETYLFLPNVEAEAVVKKMEEIFQEKIKELDLEIKSFEKPLSDIIKMASLVEEEARTEETRQIVAGILWKRLSLNMPLQVDVSFKYINGKTTANLTLTDLKIDSPYNSYLYKGLPPTPISNPGLDSIRDTVTPTKTDYLYFLSDKKGEMHYAKTFAEHLQNKELYLK